MVVICTMLYGRLLLSLLLLVLLLINVPHLVQSQTPSPSDSPSNAPSHEPSLSPTVSPVSKAPTKNPTKATISNAPTKKKSPTSFCCNKNAKNEKQKPNLLFIVADQVRGCCGTKRNFSLLESIDISRITDLPTLY